MTEQPTPSQVAVVPAWRASRRDGISPVRDGWQVIANGEWVQTFTAKHEAVAVASSLRAEAER